ncbi:SDR family NAD(P)-dependent oxidoreductase [Phenylobacterium kunshanense]|uniref:Short-chain dehydrogenase n=1 Tax=Phenylobacterium kunshanense TaxID=1445034 RepID=A0A328BNU7_9CAUL|nr:SDR family NAD(P)-dependent oxidoreductase [Phenylobacterium kunshanense]RAK67584.1 short-chain dehydrogenase [Phenylobacterium kunshanense]
MTDAYATLPPLADGGAAVITGGASGIGLAAARRFAALGLPVVIADLAGERLDEAEASLRAAGARVVAAPTDVARFEDLERLRETALAAFGHVSVLMLNAGIGLNPGGAFRNLDAWKTLIDVNMWGVVHGAHAFLPAMVEAGRPGFVIVTGSKQGITTPPGNAAYNVSKAALKAFTDSLQHELRNTEGCRLSAHLLVPGFTYTGIMASRIPEKPPGAWTPEQVVEFMLESLARGDFYILCPDNDVTRAMDEKRMAWAMGDLIENRPALSRWHPGWKDRFEAFLKG